MEISPEAVKTLREKTGAGMMDCKKALLEAEGNLEGATDILRKKGLAAAARKAGRTTAQGIVESYIHLHGRIGVLVEVNCETDFVAKNIEFHSLVKDIAMQIAATNPQYLTRDEVPEGIIQHERDILRSQAETEGKPEKILDKMVEGRIGKFYSEVCLMEQPFIKDQNKTINQLLSEAITKIGENIVVHRFARFQVGEKA
jgi:elongation factor Ts